MDELLDTPSLESVIGTLIDGSEYDIILVDLDLSVLYIYRPSTYKIGGKTILELLGVSQRVIPNIDILDMKLLDIIVNSICNEIDIRTLAMYVSNAILEITGYKIIFDTQYLIEYTQVLNRHIEYASHEHVLDYINASKVLNQIDAVNAFYVCSPLETYIDIDKAAIRITLKKYRRKG